MSLATPYVLCLLVFIALLVFNMMMVSRGYIHIEDDDSHFNANNFLNSTAITATCMSGVSAVRFNGTTSFAHFVISIERLVACVVPVIFLTYLFGNLENHLYNKTLST